MLLSLMVANVALLPPVANAGMELASRISGALTQKTFLPLLAASTARTYSPVPLALLHRGTLLREHTQVPDGSAAFLMASSTVQ